MDAAQRRSAEHARDAESARRNCSVLLDVWDANDHQFWKAEEYHQQFDFKSGEQCSGHTDGDDSSNSDNNSNHEHSNNHNDNEVAAASGAAADGHANITALKRSWVHVHQMAFRPRPNA